VTNALWTESATPNILRAWQRFMNCPGATSGVSGELFIWTVFPIPVIWAPSSDCPWPLGSMPFCCLKAVPIKVIRSSLGAVYKVPYAQMNPIALKLPGLKVVGTSAEGDTALHAFQPPARAPMLIVIGSEAHGVTPEIARRCEQTLRIEMAPGMESLNAAVAAGIVAHHLWVESLTS